MTLSTTDLFILDHLQPLSTASDPVLVGVGERDDVVELPAWALPLLSRCRGLKTLDEHAHEAWEALGWRAKLEVARRMVARMPPQAVARLDPGRRYFARMLASHFAELAQRGLFLGAPALMGALAADAPTPAPITTLGVASGHRAASLAACLESYIDHNRRWQRAPRYVVCDDSRDEATGAEYRAVLTELARRTGAAIDYAGRAEKQRFVAALARHGGFDPELLHLAFATPDAGEMAAGANRNALLLQTVGERVVSVDDDTLCKIYAPAEPESGMRIDPPGKLPFSIKLYGTREEALASGRAADCDLLALYEGHLGETVARCIGREVARDATKVELAAVQGDALHEILRGRGRVVGAFNGLVGDSGSNESIAHIFQGERQGLSFRDEAEFMGFARSREVHKQVTKPVLARPSGCMTTFFGLDNDALIPPFFPRFRNSDGVFGLMIGTLSSEWYFAHLPFQLLHAPATNRRRALADTRSNRELCFTPSQIVRSCVVGVRHGLAGSDVAAMMRRIGDAMVELADEDERQYRRRLTYIARLEKGKEIDSMQKVLAENPRAPEFWKQEVRRTLAFSRAHLTAPVLLADPKFAGEHGRDEAERRTRRMIHEYGQLLRIWPEVRQAAGELKRMGTSLAAPIVAP